MTAIQTLIEQRYGHTDAFPGNLSGVDLSEFNNPVLVTLLKHASLRHFSAREIRPEVISLLIAAAQSASTSSNLQAWSVIAVQNPEHKKNLSRLAAHQTFIQDAPLFLIWTIDVYRPAEVIQLAKPDQDLSSVVGLESVDSLLIGTIDAALAAQNLTIAAHSLGLGSVYVGAIRNNLKDVVDILELPKGVIPVFGLAVGYPQDQHILEVKPRLPQKIVLHHEVYRAENLLNEQSLQEYETILDLFQKQVGQAPDRWRDKVTQRLSALNGREHLAEIFNHQGLNIFNEKI